MTGGAEAAPPRRRGLALAFVLAVLPPAIAAPVAAGDAAAGRRKALQCQTCHGLDGLSRLPQAPHLAGQPEFYLRKSLDDFRKGIRTNEMMTLVVQSLSDEDAADLAAYYAAIEISVRPP
jgi:cytochrome c553